MEAFLQALVTLTAPLHLVLLVSAVTAGIIVGAAPGLTSTMAVGLLIPLTFAMPKEAAFILLLGIYCGAIYGGSITAILMNVPGTPTSVITAIDGYPMTVKGEGGLAISIATISSALGGLISCAFLVFLSTQLATLVIYFGAPDYFSLGVFAMVIVLVLSEGSLLRSVVAGGIGLLLATVGLDPVAGFARFTFDIPELLVGIPEVPAIIGLFCVAEALRLAEAGDIQGRLQRAVGGFGAAVRMLPRLASTIVKSGLIGTLIGVLPGIGALAASSFAYAEAKRSAKDPGSFGKGAPEGVCASETANNAVTGGALVPMLTFGIPGDTTTLLILGAMTIQGIAPGPMLFIEETTLIYVIFGAMIASNILLLPLGLGAANYIARISLIPSRYLIPSVAVLAITGAAIGYGHVYYFWIAIIFGIVGYAMQKGGFPVLPLAMGLILGPMIENNLRSAMMLPQASAWMFVQYPVSLGFLLTSLAVVVLRLWQIRKPQPAPGVT